MLVARTILRSALLLTLLLLAAGPHRAMAAPSSDTRSFGSLGYGDITARNADDSLEYYFAIPAAEVPQQGARLTLLYSHSPLLAADRSTMSVVVNGQSLASTFLGHASASQARLVVPLPAAGEQPFTDGAYFVQIQFHLRLTHEACEEAHNPALWATVSSESTLTLPTAPRADLTLSDAPDVFAPSADQPLTLVLPEHPSPQELQAAGAVAFEAGRWAAARGADPQIETATEAPADVPSISIASDASLGASATWGDLVWDGSAWAANGQGLPDGAGLLAIQGGSAPKMLIGGGAESLAVAATALVGNLNTSSLNVPSLLISGAPLAAATPPVWSEGAASFAQLGVDSRRVTGLGEHTISLPFERPAEWDLQDGGELVLAVAAPTSLDADTSWVAAEINGYSLGAQPLAGTPDAVGRAYRFPLPAGLFNNTLDGQPVRSLVLQVRLFLDMPQQACASVPAEGMWATLLPTSSWMLPHTAFEGLDLGRFPAPLLSAEAAPLVVLPAEPTLAELEAALQAVAAIGRWSAGATTLPQLRTADTVGDAELEAAPLVIIGGAERNALATKAQAERPTLAAFAEPALARPGSSGSGDISLATSPWASGQAMLLLRGSGPDGLGLAAKALGRAEAVASLRGTHVAITAGLAPELIGTPPVVAAPAELAPRVVVPLVQRVAAWQIVGAILLGALVSAIIVIVRARWRPRKTELS